MFKIRRERRKDGRFGVTVAFPRGGRPDGKSFYYIFITLWMGTSRLGIGVVRAALKGGAK